MTLTLFPGPPESFSRFFRHPPLRHSSIGAPLIRSGRSPFEWVIPLFSPLSAPDSSVPTLLPFSFPLELTLSGPTPLISLLFPLVPLPSFLFFFLPFLVGDYSSRVGHARASPAVTFLQGLRNFPMFFFFQLYQDSLFVCLRVQLYRRLFFYT